MKDDFKKNEDDGRVVADMSGLAPQRPVFLPRIPDGEADPCAGSGVPAPFGAERDGGASGARPWEAGTKEPGREEIMAALKGAIGASLLLWLVYAAVFGGFIFLLTRLFGHILGR